MDSQALVSYALRIRDDSINAVYPGLILQDPLPSNSQHLAAGLLSEDELLITNSDPQTLLDKVRAKEWLCETVVRAFLRRAAVAQKAVNCITELLPEHAIRRAQYLDSLPHPAGPLHGLPVSVKEQFGFEGRVNNNGFVAHCKRMQGPHCSLNASLEDGCGAIIFARTTEPQSVMHLETNNNIYGRTVNPWNRNLTAGGSTGGEGALIACKGSPLGVGGDIGGSIRSPAANNGIYGFKPTPLRVGNTGGMGLISGQEGILGCIGPMAPTLSGIELFMKAYLGTSPWIKESYLVPLPWRHIELPQKIKIGVMWSDGVVKPHPPILRALCETVDALRRDPGFKVVDWIPVGHDKCWELTCALYYEDGGQRLRETLACGQEEALPLTTWLLEQEAMKPRTAEDVWKLKADRNSYRAMYNQRWLDTGKEDSHPVDAILCPAGPGCAPPHDQARYWSYTSQWNLLEYPAVVFPVGRVDPGIDRPDTMHEPQNQDDAFNHALYTGPERYKDAPIALQLVTKRFEDEKCIGVLKKVEACLDNLRPGWG